MKILIKANLVDFESPFYMTEEQLKVFQAGMKKIFENVKSHDVKELERQASDVIRHPQKWEPEELIHLLSDKSHEEVASLLNRKSFSVKSKRMVWILPFRNWAVKNGYIKSGHFTNLKKAIEEYEQQEK